MRVRLVLAAALLSILAACAPKPVVVNSVAAAEILLTDAEKLALVYTKLPRCGSTATAVCSQQAVVDRIKSLDATAYSAVKAAESNAALLGVALDAIGALQVAIPAGGG